MTSRQKLAALLIAIYLGCAIFSLWEERDVRRALYNFFAAALVASVNF